MATGRTAPNGTVYGPVLKKNEDDLVPVRSIVTKKDGNLSEVTPDLLSKNFLKTDIPNGSAIGLSMGTSLTENINFGWCSLNYTKCWNDIKKQISRNLNKLDSSTIIRITSMI